jgi:N-acyl-D-aspartate/D-glutamate deacylase
MVVDGTGAPARPADVLIEGDRIAAVGAVPDDVAARAVDAGGLVVAPGFVDVHTHADLPLLAFPDADSAVRQGVTTVVIGNCGGGVAPVNDAHDIRRVAFAFDESWDVPVTWRGFGDYLALLAGKAVNVAALVPHGTLRNAVMGLAARAPRQGEADAMAALLREAMEAGAIGLSTGLEYQPGCYADTDELVALARVAADRGGAYATHMRNRAEAYGAATEEAIEIARRTGVRLQLSHVAPRPYAPADEVERALVAIHDFASVGALWVDTFPEVWGPGTLVDLLPGHVANGSAGDVARRLRDPGVRREVAAYFDEGTNFLVRAGGYEQIYIAGCPTRRELEGGSLPALAERAGASVADFCCDVLLDAGSQLMTVMIRHVYATEDDLRRVIDLPYCSFGSDGVVSSGEDDACGCRWSASTYGYAARVLEWYVRRLGVLSVEDAVRRLAALPAEAMGMRDRGVLRPGTAADVVVLDFEALRDRSSPERQARHPEGIAHVLVNGVAVLEHGRQTGERPGRVVGPGAFTRGRTP